MEKVILSLIVNKGAGSKYMVVLLLDYLYIGSFPGMPRLLVTENHLDPGLAPVMCHGDPRCDAGNLKVSTLRLSACDERCDSG